MLNKKALAGTPSTPPAFVEDVFSTWLYAGTGSNNQTITNGIDLAGKGGMVWIKSRTDTNDHVLSDTARGVDGKYLISNSTAAQGNDTTIGIQSFNADGFTTNKFYVNESATNYCSWTFRKAKKFFDVVTYTGNGAARTIAHNLGSVPGMMLVKATSGTADWNVYHRSLGNTFRLLLNSTAQAFNIGSVCWNATTPTSSVFSLGTNTGVNESGVQYVAYLFAHDAGGFGTAGTDNVISCGTFTPTGSDVTVNLGYEPQWILIKRTAGARDWFLVDNMRGWTSNSASSNSQVLNPNLSAAESDNLTVVPTATGFIIPASSAFNLDAHIYMAIRRPMKVPTTGTSVFSPVAAAAGSSTTITTNFPVDMVLLTDRSTSWVYNTTAEDRLRGGTIASITSSTNAERTDNASKFDSNISFLDGWSNLSTNNIIYHAFRRASGFFDQVCYTGQGTYNSTNHNLGVKPELVIYKRRNGSSSWEVVVPINSVSYYNGFLNDTTAFTYNSSDPFVASQYTSTEICRYADSGTIVAYLFATCAGVSKVGFYTGTGSTQTINCGFTSGARFVLIKRLDSTGDWFVWDTARGIVSGNDPYLLLNTTAAEVTNTDYIDPVSSGFEISSTAPAAINANGGSFLFLAIA